MQCKDCVYYNPFDHPNSQGKGKCHRNPPILYVKPSGNYTTAKFVITETQEDWWCGEYATELPHYNETVVQLQDWTEE